MVKRYDIEIDTNSDVDAPEWYAWETQRGEFMYASDALPYMVWQDLPEDLSELPRAELLLRYLDGDAKVINNDTGWLSTVSQVVQASYTHWALAPVLKVEEVEA